MVENELIMRWSRRGSRLCLATTEILLLRKGKELQKREWIT
jgi:hypothetical protein